MDNTILFINTFFYLTHRWDPNRYVLPLQVRVDQGAMVMKGCSTLPKLEPHHQIEFNVIPRTCRPSATAFQHPYDKKVGACHKGNRVGAIIQVLGLDMTCRLIGGGLSNRPPSSRKSQSGVFQVMDCSTTRVLSLSITGRHPRPTGGPIGGILPLCRGAVGAF